MFSSVYIHSSAVLLGSENQSFSVPDLKSILPANTLRRMSRLIKASIGIGNQVITLEEAQKLNGIITATGLGCLEDTVKFLDQMIENQDTILSPTSFIHSTHNSIAAQLALFYNCQGWNNTYSQRYFSWESAVLESAIILENADNQEFYLTLAADEIVPHLIPALKQQLCFSNDVLGEGVTAWLLSNEKKSNSIQLIDLQTYNYISNDISGIIQQHLLENGFTFQDIKLLVSNQNIKIDKLQAAENEWNIGNYFTNSAAYMELASHLLRKHKKGMALVVMLHLDGFSTALLSYVE